MSWRTRSERWAGLPRSGGGWGRLLSTHVLVLLAIAVAFAGPSPSKRDRKVPAAVPGADPDELTIVDCLLPGRVRKLGRRQTYLTARKAVRTTALDCEIRGGEYVAYDRANYATALKVWLSGAERGDPKSQNYVGEIFEKGLGVSPDYRQAASWYRRAAEQGYSGAQINLGYLYEKGLGVDRNPQEALNWYRKAVGLPDAVVLDSLGESVDFAQVQHLQEEIERLRKETQDLVHHVGELESSVKLSRTDLEAARDQERRLQDELELLKKQLEEHREQETSQVRDQAEIARLQKELADRQEELIRQREMVSRMEVRTASLEMEFTETTNLKEKLQQQEKTVEGLSSEVEESGRKHMEAMRLLDEGKQRAQRLEAELEAARSELADTRTKLTSEKSSAERVAKLEDQLDQRQTELETQREEIHRLEGVSDEYRKKLKDLAQIEQEAIRSQQLEAAAGSIAGPTIEVIDPPLVRQRGVQIVRSGVTERVVIGRVTAPAGLLDFLVNGGRESVGQNGLFQVEVPIQPPSSIVTLVAIDRQGKRAAIEFEMRAEVMDQDEQPAVASGPSVPRIKFGSYRALIIGNNEYLHLPDLQTAINDARTIATLLETKYGFRTQVIQNATRYQILSALDVLREELTEDVNLLIYYAGHGTLDPKIQRGYWLPTDAEREQTANWISTWTITDHLSVIPAKHILVIADSCYSGALTRSSLARLEAGLTPEAKNNWYKQMVKKRSRTALTSGGLNPVLDAGGGQLSIFAKAVYQVLSENLEILETRRMSSQVSALVAHAAGALRIDQVPEYAPIKFAGHEMGDFFFVPIEQRSG